MKRTTFSRLAILPIMAAALALTSCIYDRPPGDNFYRTLWKADDGILLEFLCNDGVSIRSGDSPTIYGTYSPKGNVSVLNNLEIDLQPAEGYGESDGGACDERAGGTTVARKIRVTFTEAHRISDDTLQLIWQTAGSSGNSSTFMRRLSEYE